MQKPRQSLIYRQHYWWNCLQWYTGIIQRQYILIFHHSFSSYLLLQCVWIIIAGLDIESLVDGFHFRLRVLLLTFHPKMASKRLWVSDVRMRFVLFFDRTWNQLFYTIIVKIVTVLIVIVFVLPMGKQLKRDEMRQFLEQVPAISATFNV